MKTLIHIRLAIGVLVVLAISSCSPWHYNHPRIAVDKQQTVLLQKETTPEVESNQVFTTCEMLALENEALDVTKPTEENSSEIASVDKNVITTPSNDHIKNVVPVKQSKLKKNKSKTVSYTERFKEKSQVFEVQDVEKSTLSGWVRIMVILFVVGFILLLFGIFFSIFLHGLFWWLFYMFGAMCILAGFIVLILGLVGVM